MCSAERNGGVLGYCSSFKVCAALLLALVGLQRIVQQESEDLLNLSESSTIGSGGARAQGFVAWLHPKNIATIDLL